MSNTVCIPSMTRSAVFDGMRFVGVWRRRARRCANVAAKKDLNWTDSSEWSWLATEALRYASNLGFARCAAVSVVYQQTDRGE